MALTCTLQEVSGACSLLRGRVLGWQQCGAGGWAHSLAVLRTQDNQTDSGMVLASEEFEQLESRHRQEGGLR